MDQILDDEEEFYPEFEEDEEELPVEDDEVELDELSATFVKRLIDDCIKFMNALVGHELHPYQLPLARRIIESVIINDGEEITALAARQSGKSETIANTVATLMVLLPRLAKMFPDLLGRFKDGIWVGMFAPVEGQVETLFGRTVNRLTSERALEILGDPEIDDSLGKVPGVTRQIKLKNSGSSLMMMTANPRAKIESKSFHLIVIDECQEADDFVVSKSISPMLAYYSGTMVKTGTPTTSKNNFYRSIQLNKRRQTSRGKRQNHFEWDYKDVSKCNVNYEKFIRKEKLRIGEDSDEFQMSYCCKWLLERGMFVTSSIMHKLGDTSQELVKSINTLNAGIISCVVTGIISYSGPQSIEELEQYLEFNRIILIFYKTKGILMITPFISYQKSFFEKLESYFTEPDEQGNTSEGG